METYMHVNAMDIAFQIVRKAYETDDEIVAYGRWMCLGYEGKPWYLPPKDVVRVTLKQKENWIKIPQELLFKPRKRPGLPQEENN